MHKYKDKVFMTENMRAERNLIHEMLSTPKKCFLETQITHINPRDPDFITFGDTCLEAGGGIPNDMFWWYTEWSDEIKCLTLKNIIITRKCKITNQLVSINLLEFVAEIINYAAITTFLQFDMTSIEQEYPIQLDWTDNRTT